MLLSWVRNIGERGYVRSHQGSPPQEVRKVGRTPRQHLHSLMTAASADDAQVFHIGGTHHALNASKSYIDRGIC